MEINPRPGEGILRPAADPRIGHDRRLPLTGLFLFYVFWEATLIPMALIIGMYGHERALYAAVKFFLYTMVASVFMLASIIWL